MAGAGKEQIPHLGLCRADPLARAGGAALLSSQSSKDLFLGGSGPSLPGWGCQPLLARGKLSLEPGGASTPRTGEFPVWCPGDDPPQFKPVGKSGMRTGSGVAVEINVLKRK